VRLGSAAVRDIEDHAANSVSESMYMSPIITAAESGAGTGVDLAAAEEFGAGIEAMSVK
jgi:hypothetical protein